MKFASTSIMKVEYNNIKRMKKNNRNRIKKEKLGRLTMPLFAQHVLFRWMERWLWTDKLMNMWIRNTAPLLYDMKPKRKNEGS